MTKINKLADNAKHIADVYQASLDAAREYGIDQLARYREIGKYIIELNATFNAGRGKTKGNKKLKTFIYENNLEALWASTPSAKQDRSDAIFIAQNWKALKKFMTKQSMDSGSANYVRKEYQKSLRKAGKSKATNKPNKQAVKLETSNSLPATKRSSPANEQAAFEQASTFLELCLFTDRQLVAVYKRIGLALKISEKAKAIAEAKKAGNKRRKAKDSRIKVTAAKNKKVSEKARKGRAKAKANNEAPALTHVAAS